MYAMILPIRARPGGKTEPPQAAPPGRRTSTGTTPYQWLVRQRVQLAQRLLEMSDLPMDSVAEKSGFSTAANLRKHFSRTVHTSPQAYRHTFQDRRAS
jgi:transcriptional regulator GlxA family with amidase domain